MRGAVSATFDRYQRQRWKQHSQVTPTALPAQTQVEAVHVRNPWQHSHEHASVPERQHLLAFQLEPPRPAPSPRTTWLLCSCADVVSTARAPHASHYYTSPSIEQKCECQARCANSKQHTGLVRDNNVVGVATSVSKAHPADEEGYTQLPSFNKREGSLKLQCQWRTGRTINHLGLKNSRAGQITTDKTTAADLKSQMEGNRASYVPVEWTYTMEKFQISGEAKTASALPSSSSSVVIVGGHCFAFPMWAEAVLCLGPSSFITILS